MLGSWHCAGMCGPIASLMNQKKGLLLYHLGRLMSYTIAGSIIGQFGKLFLQTHIYKLRLISIFMFALIMISLGLILIFNFEYQKWILNSYNPFSKFYKKSTQIILKQSPFFVGFLSIALPCSWLWSFLALAAASQSPLRGALTLFIFWLGGIPALNALPFISRRLIQNASLGQKKIAGFVLLFSALYAILSFFNF